jgi:hypothetical protein
MGEIKMETTTIITNVIMIKIGATRNQYIYVAML